MVRVGRVAPVRKIAPPLELGTNVFGVRKFETSRVLAQCMGDNRVAVFLRQSTELRFVKVSKFRSLPSSSPDEESTSREWSSLTRKKESSSLSRLKSAKSFGSYSRSGGSELSEYPPSDRSHRRRHGRRRQFVRHPRYPRRRVDYRHRQHCCRCRRTDFRGVNDRVGTSRVSV
ncbi:hypothetical protein DPMN_153000 [Dreissena polymorpha]|uniref:Uncharacterized protein n=1 Tax=Dreissena polymorpha TaxID=45954 RepID=A0A9D4FJC0_DREPO|nr:hypothetical protein DPMN_153000 [Dreissena polymorpha]